MAGIKLLSSHPLLGKQLTVIAKRIAVSNNIIEAPAVFI
ncbi:Uncharacterised protein [Salmonella enterica subsp. enterica]|uniref:Uncharacterized protein n=1 Tax=Salmonella enterica I TaxID=59201 RepID=A0A379X299_SALET|nr:Uncharacterised protein [Salmonella enterica subsp. enterica]